MDEVMASVIMPVYNGERYIDRAIESVLSQSFKQLELILISDCPADASMDRIRRYQDPRIVLLQNARNMGIAYSRNLGIEKSRGKYIALLDDDDVALEKRLELQVDYLEKNSDIDLVGGKYQLIDEEDRVIGGSGIAYWNPLYIKALFLFQNIYSNGEVTFRKELIDKHQIRYCDHQMGMEDFKFWIDCSKVGRFSTIDEVVLKHRIHTASETSKTMRERFSERTKRRKELLRYSMELSGVYLDDREMETIYQYTNQGKCESKKAFQEYYLALKKIVSQAAFNQLDCLEELKILCTKYLSVHLRQVKDLWE